MAEDQPSQADNGAAPVPPCVFVIFGATGDLTRRLLLPSLLNLLRNGLLPDNFAILGVAREDANDQAFRERLTDALKEFAIGGEPAPDAVAWLTERASYLRGSFDDPATFQQLGQRLEEIDAARGTKGNRLFYCATPSGLFGPIARGLAQAGLVRQEGGTWQRYIVEKPFGTDLASARALNRELLAVLGEDQIYRIDHYLGKETVQNILVLRFNNEIFERLWNRDHIDHVQITVAETVGVERRGAFYDATGALRDMVPNHLFQLLSMVAMEPPTCFSADAVRGEKAKVLDAVRDLTPEDVRRDVVRGQYAAGKAGDRPLDAYRRSPDVAGSSVTETYVAMKLAIDNWRWTGVPFYLRTGKALTKRRSEVAIHFKKAPFALFRDTGAEQTLSNDLILHIQPEEGATLCFGAKVPGPTVRLGEVQMRFSYADYFEARPSTGYETLLYDCMIGDATLFQRADNIEWGWQVVDPILALWSAERTEPEPYAAGSAGPEAADRLLERDGRRWRPIV